MEQNIVLSRKTKDASVPAGAKRVYCAYHPNDAGYLDAVARVLWEKEDCVLYYYDYEAYGE